MELFRLLGTIAIEKADAIKALEDTKRKGKETETTLSGAFKTIGQKYVDMGKKMALVSTAATGAFAGIVKSSASVAAEVSAYEQIMGSYADTASKKLAGVADAVGMTDTRLTPYMTSMTAKFQGLGLGIEQSTDLASSGLTIAADAAAFWDKSLEDSMSALNSFVNGNYEGGEAIGLFANETTLARYAAEELGLEWQNMTEAEKQITRLKFAEEMQKKSKVTGQAAKEAGQYANVMAELKEAIRQMAASIGEVALPVVTKMVQGLTFFIQKAEGMNTALKVVIVALLGITAVASPLLIIFGQMCNGIGSMIDLYGRLTKKQAASAASSHVLAESNWKLSSSYISLKASEIADTIATKANTVAKGLNAAATKIQASSIYKLITAHKLATVAALGLAAPLIALAVYMAKTGETGEEIAQKITDFSEKVAAMIPQLTDKLVAGIDAIIQTLPTLLPVLIQAGLKLFMGLVQSLIQIIEPLVAALPQIIEAISATVPVLIPALLEAAVLLFMAFVQAIPEIIPALIEGCVLILNTLKSSLANGVSKIWDSIRSTAKSKWDSIKTAIIQPVENARDKVKALIDKIRSFFNFSWSLPKLKMPHITISGKFKLNPPTAPKFSIRWYKKAMDEAMLLNSPTIFGYGDGQFLGGGEAGQEVVAGSETLMNMVRTAVASENSRTHEAIERLTGLIGQYLPAILDGMDKDLVLDTGALVGGTRDAFYKEMGVITATKSRRGLK